MDEQYMKGVLNKILAYRSIHEEKYADNALHQGCLPRLDKVISQLRQELGDNHRLDFSISESALPDAIEEALMLEHAAEEMLLQNDMESASMLKRRSQEVLFKELNELDGFDR